jgi:CheY-like chemotaxis protein
MNLESLLMSRDPETIRVLRPTLEKLAIDVEVCRGARSGNEIVNSEKFDAIIVDCDDLQGGLDVLRGLRKTPSNKGSAAFAILNGKTNTQQAFEMGASFVLQKPISALSAMRCFSAALNMMERERRRYFRYPVELPVIVLFRQGEELKAHTTNLSEGGMAIRFRDKLPKSGISKVSFTLSGTQVELSPKADLAWSDGAGRAGLRFVEVPESTRDRLDRWLFERMEQMAEIASAPLEKSAKAKSKKR